jgi:hypothetical protein
MRSDYSLVIVGEWGVTQSDFHPAEEPTTLSHLFGLIKPWANIMFFFAHPEVANENGVWGLQSVGVSPGNPGQYLMAGRTNLWQPFNAIVGE